MHWKKLFGVLRVPAHILDLVESLYEFNSMSTYKRDRHAARGAPKGEAKGTIALP